MHVRMVLPVIRWGMLVALGLALGLGLCSCKSEAEHESKGLNKVFSYQADGIDISMTVRGTDISVAGLVEIVFEVTHPSDVELVIAESDDWCGELELYAQIAAPGKLIEGGKRIARTLRYSLEPPRAGDYEVDEIKIDYWHTTQALRRQRISTEAFTVQVHSLLADMVGADANSADILDIEGPWLPQENKSYGPLLVTGVVMCGGILIWHFKRKTGKEAVESVPERGPSPGERALVDLKTLLAERLCEQALFDPFYVRLSDIMRQYIEARFNCPVLSQTTEEFLTAMAGNELFDQAHKEILGAFLRESDEWKFAGIGVRTELIQASMENCRGFITRTMEDSV
jgi:hypothetical protein